MNCSRETLIKTNEWFWIAETEIGSRNHHRYCVHSQSLEGTGDRNKTRPTWRVGSRRPEAPARHKQTWTHHRARPSVLEGIELSLLPQSFIEFLVQRAKLIRSEEHMSELQSH